MSEFDFDKLRQNIEQGMEEIATRSLGESPDVTMLPRGNHVVRLIADPAGCLYGKTWLHKYRDTYAYCHSDSCGICSVAEEILGMLLALGREKESHLYPTVHMFYKFYLQVIQTDAESETWQEGKTYVTVTSENVGIQLMRFIYFKMISAASKPTFDAMLNPHRKSRCIEIRMTKVIQQTENISLHPFLISEGVGLCDWYVPLDDYRTAPVLIGSHDTVHEAASAAADTIRTWTATGPVPVTGRKPEQLHIHLLNAGNDNNTSGHEQHATPPACFGHCLRNGNNDLCLHFCQVTAACQNKTLSPH